MAGQPLRDLPLPSRREQGNIQKQNIMLTVIIQNCRKISNHLIFYYFLISSGSFCFNHDIKWIGQLAT